MSLMGARKLAAEAAATAKANGDHDLQQLAEAIAELAQSLHRELSELRDEIRSLSVPVEDRRPSL